MSDNQTRISTTAMFIAEGLHDAGYDKVIEVAHDLGMGWDGVLYEIARNAEVIDTEASFYVANGCDYPGVFDYEVSVFFGQWIGVYMVEQRMLPLHSEAKVKCQEMVAKFFNRK